MTFTICGLYAKQYGTGQQLRKKHLHEKYGDWNRYHCRDCGRFISYSNITKDFDGCYNCDPQAEWRDKI